MGKYGAENTKECFNCRTRSTPLWRKGDKGETLCNACGLYYRHHNGTFRRTIGRKQTRPSGDKHSKPARRNSLIGIMMNLEDRRRFDQLLRRSRALQRTCNFSEYTFGKYGPRNPACCRGVASQVPLMPFLSDDNVRIELACWENECAEFGDNGKAPHVIVPVENIKEAIENLVRISSTLKK